MGQTGGGIGAGGGGIALLRVNPMQHLVDYCIGERLVKRFMAQQKPEENRRHNKIGGDRRVGAAADRAIIDGAQDQILNLPAAAQYDMMAKGFR